MFATFGLPPIRKDLQRRGEPTLRANTERIPSVPCRFEIGARSPTGKIAAPIPELIYFRSEIDDDVVARLRAAGQHIAVDRRIYRGWFVAHRSLQERGLARVADTSPARPSRGNVARLGKLKQALKLRSPADIQTASGERYQRSGTRLSSRGVRRRARRGCNARRHGRRGAKSLGPDTACSNAPACEARSEIAHKGGRSA